MRVGTLSGVRAIILLVIAITLQAAGNVCLSLGMKQLGSVVVANPAEWPAMAWTAVGSPSILVGVALLTAFFILFGYLLARLDLSIAVPVISLEVLINVAAAHWILGEAVSPTHWIGAGLVTLGVAFVGLSARPKLERHL